MEKHNDLPKEGSGTVSADGHMTSEGLVQNDFKENPPVTTQGFSAETAILLGFVQSQGLVMADKAVVDERIKQLCTTGKGLLDDLVQYEEGALIEDIASKYAERFDDSNDINDLVKVAALFLAEIDAMILRKLLSKGYNGVGQPVSSQVDNIAYNPKNKVLTVTFKTGVYEYAQVPLQVYIDAFKSESIGKFINSTIKAEGYAYTKVS